jgi:hypothetical protein
MPDEPERTAREEVVDGLGRVAPDEARALERGPRRLDERVRVVEDNRGWLLAVAATMSVMAVVLPTAGLYRLFSAVGRLSEIELVAAIAAACLVAAAQMAVAVYLYLRWEARRLCYRVLRALDRETGPSAAGGRPGAPSDAAPRRPPNHAPARAPRPAD